MPSSRFARRSILAGFASAPLVARAQAPVQIIVPFPPGGASDLMARYAAQRLGERRGQPVAVVNRPGGAAAIGTEAVARAAPDGNTILFGASYLAIAPHLFPNLPYDPVRDLAPLGAGASIPLVLYGSTSLGARTIAEALERLRARPDGYNFASAGNATLAHIGAALFMQQSGTRLVHVPYQGTAPAMTDMVAGRAHLIIDGIGAGIAHVDAGRLVPLMICGTERQARLPQVPSAPEAGLPDVLVEAWNAFFVPAATPAAARARLAADLAAVMSDEAARAWLAERNFVALAEGPESFARRFAAESARWAGVIRAGGIRAD
jgi:tripartite-type tricarboxylate transporter receptor subunit TctC